MPVRRIAFLTLQAVLCTSVHVYYHENIKLVLDAGVISVLFYKAPV